MKSPLRGSFSLMADPCPSPRLLGEIHLLPLAHSGDLRHLRFRVLVLLAKLGDFSQAVFDAASEIILFGLRQTQFVAVVLPDLGGPLREFRLEARPCGLVLAVVLVLEQPKSFFGGKLGDAGEILNAEAIQNLCAAEFARATAQAGIRFFRSAMKMA